MGTAADRSHPPGTAADHSRREFLRLLGHAARGSAVAFSAPAILAACDAANEARRADRPFVNLAPDEAVTLRAMAARIMPSDDTPGAEEAGVVYFMEQAAADPARRDSLRTGLNRFADHVRSHHGRRPFAALEPSRQDVLLRDVQDGEFFRTVRFLTMAGMFCLPEYGGNRDLAGYQAIGFESRHAWAPPFGHYDAAAAQGEL